MTLKVKKQYEQEIEIQVPSFWRREDGRQWTAIVDESTVISFYNSDSLVTIRHGDPDDIPTLMDDIRDANDKYELCSEGEWITEYRKVLKSITLDPCITVDSLYS